MVNEIIVTISTTNDKQTDTVESVHKSADEEDLLASLTNTLA